MGLFDSISYESLTFDWDGMKSLFEQVQAKYGLPASDFERQHGNWARTGFCYEAFYRVAVVRVWEWTYAPGRNGVVAPSEVTVNGSELWTALQTALGRDPANPSSSVTQAAGEASAGAQELVSWVPLAVVVVGLVAVAVLLRR